MCVCGCVQVHVHKCEHAHGGRGNPWVLFLRSWPLCIFETEPLGGSGVGPLGWPGVSSPRSLLVSGSPAVGLPVPTTTPGWALNSGPRACMCSKPLTNRVITRALRLHFRLSISIPGRLGLENMWMNLQAQHYHISRPESMVTRTEWHFISEYVGGHRAEWSQETAAKIHCQLVVLLDVGKNESQQIIL